MKKTILILWLLSLQVLGAANWYVSSTVATSGNGQSWATAWKNSTNIVWGSIAAGDTIFFDGGSSGLSYAAFNTITASGTSGNYITIARSLESGRDGIVTIATPFTVSGSFVKFDGGDFKAVGTNTYRCGIVFTCSGSMSGVPSGASVVVSGQNPYFKYCYFNGTYGAGGGHSFGARNSTGFTLEYCWFYQSCWEDQWEYEATASGANVNLTNCIFQDNNKPNRTDTDHRDVANPWTGAGGWNLYVTGCIFFNTLNRAGVSGWQGDELLLQVGYGGSTSTPMGQVIAVNNVFYNVYRTIAFGSQNSGVNSFIMNNNTVRATDPSYGELGSSVASPASGPNGSNNIGNSSNPGFINVTNPLGADGIPFTTDDGYFLSSASSSAINAGTNNGVTTDIRRVTRTGLPDLGAYEFVTAVTGPPTLASATINSAGNQIALVFDQTVQAGSGGNGGWTLNVTPSAGLGTVTGVGSNTLTYNISGRVINLGESVTISYIQPGNGIESVASGADLASISNRGVTNNSTQGQTSAPVITLPAGAYFGTQTTTITDADSGAGAVIHYTVDGTPPTAASPVYSAPITLPTNQTVRAIATWSGHADSAGVSSAYEVVSWITFGTAFKTFAVPQKTGTFTWSFSVLAPAADSDCVVGLAPSAVSTFTGMACIVQFFGNTINAINGGSYTTGPAYTPGALYNFVATINVAAHTWSVTVTPAAGGTTTTIATNAAFRTEQASAAQLSWVGIQADPGTITVNNMSFPSGASSARYIGLRGVPASGGAVP